MFEVRSNEGLEAVFATRIEAENYVRELADKLGVRARIVHVGWTDVGSPDGGDQS
jgi:hypothetical protein